jgi:undecaprenyl diphosphate synthase
VALGIDRAHLPRHVAIVMDGNGRWAKQRGLKRTEGHAAGEHALFDTVEGALDIGLEWMTVYAFSTENWRRPVDEVRYLMNFNENLLLRRRDELHDRGVRVRFIGRRGGRVPGRLRRQIADAEHVPAYVVFNDATLREMARQAPQSLPALRAVVGVGPAKLARYGPRFLAVLRGESA